MNKKRFISGIWCKKCNKEISVSTCPDCGSSFYFGGMDPFASIEQEWVPHHVIWWDPLTWIFRGHWKTIGAKTRGL